MLTCFNMYKTNEAVSWELQFIVTSWYPSKSPIVAFNKRLLKQEESIIYFDCYNNITKLKYLVPDPDGPIILNGMPCSR